MMVEDALLNNKYFSRPTSSQDKGKFENRIGQIRRFFQKKIDLSGCCKRTKGKKVEQLLNDRPARKFNYQTINQVLQGKISLII